jgi:hypothetical protein
MQLKRGRVPPKIFLRVVGKSEREGLRITLQDLNRTLIRSLNLEHQSPYQIDLTSWILTYSHECQSIDNDFKW